MTAAVSRSPSAPAVKRKGGFWHDLKLVFGTAAVTSLFWIGLIVFDGGGIFASTVTTAAPPSPGADAALPRPGFAPVTGEPNEFVPSRRPALAPGQLLIPVDGVPVSALVDTFDAQRGDRLHEALDIIAPTGTPVVAAAAGTVEKLFLSEDGGKTVYVRSPDGARMFYYAHLDSYAPGLAEGHYLRAGDRIGSVGATGNANPAVPHLHFAIMQMAPGEAWWEGTPVNPFPILSRSARP